MLTFEPIGHCYRWNGKVVPSVTQLLDQCTDAFAHVAEDVLEAAKDRGTYVHKLTEMSDLDELDDEVECTKEHWPRLLAWRKFCADKGANWSEIETQGYSKRYGYAGTVDRRGKLERFTGPTLWTIDVKTSESASRSWGLQTAAYRQIAVEEDMQWALSRRACVRLLADGTYRFDEFTSPKDWPAFAAILTFLDWKNHG